MGRPSSQQGWGSTKCLQHNGEGAGVCGMDAKGERQGSSSVREADGNSGATTSIVRGGC